MIKACIFDLDGTLTDTVESIARGVNLALEYFGYAPRPVQEYNYYAGDGIDMAWRRALAAAGDAEGRHFQEGLYLCRKRFGENSLYRVKPYPQITETVEELKKRGIKTAVFSNKPHEAAVRVVEHVFGKGFLDVIQGQTPEVPKKPDPAGVFRIMEHFSAKPSECLYFGDTNTDMETGRRAGIFTVGVTWGFRPRSELEACHADRIIDSPPEIIDVYKEKDHER